MIWRATHERLKGHLFRTVVDRLFVERPEIGVRLANLRDVAAILAISDGFFSDEQEIRTYIAGRELLLYEDPKGLIGCGLVHQVVPGRAGHDIGMLINPSRRKMGYGEYVVRHLKAHCFALGFRPICGCSADNMASRACLERAGFRSADQLIEFDISSSRL